MKRILLFFALAATLASCRNLVPYTDAMKKNHNWSTDQVKQIQFYVSDNIVLHRELSGASTEIVQGKIKMVNGRKVDEILIKAGTPGVFTDMPKEGKMMVSFEMGDDHSLSFGVNPDKGDKYVLLASEWSNGMGRVHYAGSEYYTSPNSRFSYLMVNLRKIDRMDVRQHVAKGRKVK